MVVSTTYGAKASSLQAIEPRIENEGEKGRWRQVAHLNWQYGDERFEVRQSRRVLFQSLLNRDYSC
jgi:hypothetical protein